VTAWAAQVTKVVTEDDDDLHLVLYQGRIT
jgi:hypothetical protein